jgi:hypothetical protein
MSVILPLLFAAAVKNGAIVVAGTVYVTLPAKTVWALMVKVPLPLSQVSVKSLFTFLYEDIRKNPFDYLCGISNARTIKNPPG